MSRKQRDAFRCTEAAFGEICRLLRSSIGIIAFGDLGGVHSSDDADSSILKSLSSDAQGPGETGETATYPRSMVLVPSLYKIG